VHNYHPLFRQSLVAKTTSNLSETARSNDHWKDKVFGIVSSVQNQLSKISKILHDFYILFSSYIILVTRVRPLSRLKGLITPQ